MSNVAKATIGLMIVTMISKVLGFGREMVLSSFYATSWYVDSYVIALSIPTIMFAAIGGAISTSLIPIYSTINKEKGKQEGNKFISNLINILIVLLLVFLIIGLFFTEPLVRVFAVGLEGQTFKLAVDFTRILLFGILFTGINYIFVAYLQVHGNFEIPGLISLPYSIVIIISIILSAKFNNIYILAYGTLIAIIVQPLFQLPFVINKGFKYEFVFNIKDEEIKKLIKLIIPVLIGVSVWQLNNLVDKTIASTFEEGTIASFNYALKLYFFVQGLFITSIVTVIYPHLSNLLSNRRIDCFKKAIVKGINIIFILVIPIAVGAIVLSVPVVKLVFERGEFTSSSTIITSNILSCYALGLISYGVSDIICRALYSLEDTKSPMINSVFVVAINIILNIILSRMLGYTGLAIASTIANYAGVFLYIYILRKKIGSFGLSKIAKVSMKCSISSIVMGIVVSITYNKLSTILGVGTIQLVVSLGVSVLIGAITYGILIYILKVKEMNMIIDYIKDKINKRKSSEEKKACS